jgi:O-antigen/teichoic acid export membrane protein
MSAPQIEASPARPTAPPAHRAADVLRRAVTVSAVGKAAELVTLVALALLVPRLLGPADFGRFSVALTIVTIASVAMMLGGPTLMARYVPAAPPGERAALARALTARLAVGRAAQLAVVALAAGVLVAVDPSAFPADLTALVLVSLALSVAATLALQAGLGLGRTGPWSARYPLQNAVLVVAVLVLYPVGGVTAAVAGIALSCAVALGLAALTAGPALCGPRTAVELPAGALRFAMLQAAGGALAQLAHRGGVVAVALLAGSTVQTGHAALALGVALAATYAVAQAFTVALPGLVERGSEEPGLCAGEAALRRLAGLALAIIVPAALATALLLEDLVPAVFGAAYTGAAGAFAPALAMVVLAPVNALALQAAALRLRPEATLHSAVAGAVVFALTALVAVPSLGATGGTAAALAGTVAAALVSIRLLPGAVGGRVGAASLGGAAAVLLLALAVT